MHGIFSGFEFMMRGGFMMYPLLISALIALTVVLERLYTFHWRFENPKGALPEIIKYIRNGNLEEAKKHCEAAPAPFGDVLLAGVAHLFSPIEEMELAMKNQAEKWVPILEKRIEIVDTIITAAPLMGLLGTITGMMASFQVLSEKGVNEPNAITGGVAEALIATATGLVIALLCLVAYNYLSNWVKSTLYQLEGVASQLIEARMSAQRLKGWEHGNSP